MKKLIRTAVFLSYVLVTIAQNDANGSTSDSFNNHIISINDQNTVYNHYAHAGGKEIRTKTSYFAPCQVWVQTMITKLFVNGVPRINPDNTYYPGDGFSYSFSYGWSGNKGCRNFKVCPVESNLFGSWARCDLEKIKSIKSMQTGSSSGAAEIPTNYYSSSYIQLTVAAERYFCIYSKPKVICGWTPIVATGIYKPTVITPNTEILITQEFLKDKDGFVSANLDKTYYLWDAINLVHNPKYLWKQDRIGTLSVKVSKTHDLKLEQEFQCDSKLCKHTLNRQGFEPWQRDYEYGSGTTLMNATRQDDQRKHAVFYRVDLFNLGRLIDTQENKTEVLVVRYDPVYTKYPYLVLKDGHAFSWGNRPAIALNYLGSLGGGQDDTQEIHEQRRSKINSYEYSGYAFDPVVQKQLNQSLTWSDSNPIHLSNSCIKNFVDSDSFQSAPNKAMFVKKGFGKIIFSYPILHTMLDKRYINATIQNTLQSSSFAGDETKNLTSYKYQYPDLKFSNPIKIFTFHSDGSMTNLPITLELIPDTTKGANYTHDYVCNKVVWDTKKPEFAEIVVSDMYGKENRQNGTGHVNLKSRLTSTWFPPFYSILAKNMLELELNTAYGVPSPYKIVVTVGEKTRTLQKILNFLSPFTHVANLDTDNVLNATLESGFVRIHPNEQFGDIVNVTINGVILAKDCTTGCTTVMSGQGLKIEAWNAWGGRAFTFIESPQTMTRDYSYNWDLVAIVIFVAAIAWISYKMAEKAISNLRHL